MNSRSTGGEAMEFCVLNSASLTACTTRDAAISWIAEEGAIDDVVTLDAACAIVLNLYRVRATMPECEVRKLHTLVELPQTIVLRAMRHLDRAGVILLTENLHDPLGAYVSLPDAVATKVEQLGASA